MSTFSRLTKNPKTGKFEKATWHDNYFKHYHYGVEFSDGIVVDPDKIKLETKPFPEQESDNKELIEMAENEIKEWKKLQPLLRDIKKYKKRGSKYETN